MAQAMTASQRHWVDLAAHHADDFATRAAQHDRENSYPVENIEALKASGYTCKAHRSWTLDGRAESFHHLHRRRRRVCPRGHEQPCPFAGLPSPRVCLGRGFPRVASPARDGVLDR